MTTTTPINALPVPQTTNAQDQVANFSALATQADSRLVPRYSSMSARGIANPSPVDGQLAYNIQESLFTLRQEGSWVVQEIGKTIYKTQNESLTSNVAYQNDDELLFSAEANSTYVVEVFFSMSGADDSASLAGMNFQFAAPVGTTFYGYYFWGAARGNGSRTDGNANAGFVPGPTTPGPTGLGTATGSTCARIRLVLATGSAPGVVNFQWAQAVSNGTPVTLQVGSTLEYTKIS